jgi:gliding motility-associated-like protein
MRKIFKYCLLLFFLQALTYKGEAQITIPDPVFRQFLVNNYPLVMNGSQQLVPLAASLTLNFICNSQAITDFTGLQYFTGLTSLTINNTLASHLPSLGNMLALTNLNCANNQLIDLPDLSGNLLLLSIDCSNNNLISLPDLSLHVALISADFSNNKLTFEDFLPSIGNPVFNTGFVIHPQDSIAVNRYLEFTEGNSFSYSFNADQGVSNTVFAWYKDGNLFASGASSGLYIPELNKTDAGKYICSITNSNVPALTLTTQEIYLKVNECTDKCIKEITPDGDGINDTYYISDSGTAKIYDRNGVLIKQLSLPSSWDGTTANNALGTSGLYLIDINGEKQVKVYLFR